MRQFDRGDWSAYSGCEKFSDGGEPVIAMIRVSLCSGHVVDADLIGDRQGIHILSHVHMHEFALDLPLKVGKVIIIEIVRALESKVVFDRQALIENGFIQVA